MILSHVLGFAVESPIRCDQAVLRPASSEDAGGIRLLGVVDQTKKFSSQRTTEFV